RDRSPEEYREILRRISAGVDELVQISGDLALFSDPPGARDRSAAAAPLDGVLLRVHEKYRDRHDVAIAVEGSTAVRRSAEEDRLMRAIVLIVEHAVRHRKADGTVTLRVMPSTDRRVRLVLDAPPSGFWPHAWQAVIDDPAGAAGPLRLRTAQRLF